ncbi:hypothetical protein [Paenibacillus aceti]|uniref:Uncharacterized protein n=1 Tax=Paenibacillus aceti TaxID=1820010 RepID=A0ABQ1W0M4_9BACL|nr:hypothetical protein [Paenibacillus aceti]GGG08695.1 hypothetical protein GCM10010913_33070 [Paenibacillus aceti]
MSQQKAKESILKAHELRNDNTRFYREFNDAIRKEITAVKEDRNLSPEGQTNKVSEIKEKRGKELMQQVYKRRQEFRAHLSEARKHAEEVIYTKIPKPDATKIDRFDEALRVLKTEIMLTHNAKSAAAKLTAFIEGIEEPYFAHKVSEQFGELAGSILAVEEPGELAKTRYALSQQFSGLTSKYESPEAGAARDSLETATALDQTAFFNEIVRGAVNDTLGTYYGSYINRTDDYFAAHEDERPKEEIKKDANPKQQNDPFEWTEEQRDFWRRINQDAREREASKATE